MCSFVFFIIPFCSFLLGPEVQKYRDQCVQNKGLRNAEEVELILTHTPTITAVSSISRVPHYLLILKIRFKKSALSIS